MELPEEYKNGRTEVYRTERAVVTLHWPVLTPEERKIREKRLEKGLEDFYHACIDHGLDWDEIVKKARAKRKEILSKLEKSKMMEAENESIQNND